MPPRRRDCWSRGGKELCLSCHERARFSRPYGHRPVQEGCAACHRPHSSPHEDQLTAAPTPLCQSCHDPKAPRLAQAHGGLEVTGGKRCTGCHGPHSSTKKALLREVIHRPLTGCRACHEPGGQVKGKGDVQGLCYSCHTKEKANFSRGALHPVSAEGKCLSCHSPHASDFPGVLVKAQGEVCLSCHPALAAKATRNGEAHRPFVEGQYTECHSPHSSAVAYQLQRPPDKLCLSCHQALEQPLGEKSEALHQPFKEGSCLGCHTGHRSTFFPLLVKGDPDICLTCHTNELEKREAFEKAHLGRDPQKVRCLGCHEPHRAADNKLLHANAHQPFVKEECRACHPS